MKNKFFYLNYIHFNLLCISHIVVVNELRKVEKIFWIHPQQHVCSKDIQKSEVYVLNDFWTSSEHTCRKGLFYKSRSTLLLVFLIEYFFESLINISFLFSDTSRSNVIHLYYWWQIRSFIEQLKKTKWFVIYLCH